MEDNISNLDFQWFQCGSCDTIMHGQADWHGHMGYHHPKLARGHMAVYVDDRARLSQNYQYDKQALYACLLCRMVVPRASYASHARQHIKDTEALKKRRRNRRHAYSSPYNKHAGSKCINPPQGREGNYNEPVIFNHQLPEGIEPSPINFNHQLLEGIEPSTVLTDEEVNNLFKILQDELIGINLNEKGGNLNGVPMANAPEPLPACMPSGAIGSYIQLGENSSLEPLKDSGLNRPSTPSHPQSICHKANIDPNESIINNNICENISNGNSKNPAINSDEKTQEEIGIQKNYKIQSTVERIVHLNNPAIKNPGALLAQNCPSSTYNYTITNVRNPYKWNINRFVDQHSRVVAIFDVLCPSCEAYYKYITRNKLPEAHV